MYNDYKVMRPSILPDDSKILRYYLLTMSILILLGLILGNRIMILLPSIIIGLFPGLPICVHFLFYLLVKIELVEGKIIIYDNDFFSPCRIIKTGNYQEMNLNDIQYIYYAHKEIKEIIKLEEYFKKYKIKKNERNFEKDYLCKKYNIPFEYYDDYYNKNQLTDEERYSICFILNALYKKYKIPCEVAENINEELLDNNNLNYEYITKRLSEFLISMEDLSLLKDEFDNIKKNMSLTVLTNTKVNISAYKSIMSDGESSYGLIRVILSLVLSNKDGSKKIYIKHFDDLSKESKHELMKILNANNNINYIMSIKDKEVLLNYCKQENIKY